MPSIDRRAFDRQRAAEKPWRRWYWTARWRAIAKRQRRDHPLCVMCEQGGRVTLATICDHVEPHRGDAAKFWRGPFQSLCKMHHDSTKQREEHGHVPQAIGADGWPLTIPGAQPPRGVSKVLRAAALCTAPRSRA